VKALPLSSAVLQGGSASSSNSKAPSFWQYIRTDVDYAEYIAYQMDKYTAIVLAAGYALALILIFALNNGYVDLFNTTEST
jgi:hypothetical protein